MEVIELLDRRRSEIMHSAEQGLRAANLKHYEGSGESRARRRLEYLLLVTEECIQENDLSPMVKHAEKIAQERFDSGFGLYEIQTAFNALEEALWLQILHDLKPNELSEALKTVSAVLGMGKDAFAHNYVSLSCKTKTPSVEAEELFKGTVG